MGPVRILRSVALVAVVAAGAPCASADIYTWVDATGTTNVSNLAPPEDTRVTGVIKTSAVRPVDPDAERDAAVRVLAERVRQLQDEIEAARRAPPPPAYAYGAPAPPPQYVDATMPAPLPYYETASTESPGPACDPAFQFCGLGWGFAGVPAVIVWTAPHVRHLHGLRGSARGFASRIGRMQSGGRRH